MSIGSRYSNGKCMNELVSTCSANEYFSVADTFRPNHEKWARTKEPVHCLFGPANLRRRGHARRPLGDAVRSRAEVASAAALKAGLGVDTRSSADPAESDTYPRLGGSCAPVPSPQRSVSESNRNPAPIMRRHDRKAFRRLVAHLKLIV